MFLIPKRFSHVWIKPNGYNTQIQIYNCRTKSKVPFIVQDKHFVTWYTCGPTVYDSAHIGHASCFVKLDIIQRILRHKFALNIVHVMNITDIDDKIIKRAMEVKKTCREIAQHYEQEFWHDLARLNVARPLKVVRVTEHMHTIIEFIEALWADGKCYRKEDGVYFDLKKYKGYGKLQNVAADVLSDFVLWKDRKGNEPFWECKYGAGRPGWHIECSALASHYLGKTIDVHAGGLDLRFPHHENEEAQSCAYHGTDQWVNYWMHTGHLHTSKTDEKMSKSLKNTISIADLLRDYTANEFRMACLMSSYRHRMDFTPELMHTAQNYLKSYKNFIGECTIRINGKVPCQLDRNEVLRTFNECIASIEVALRDDFNTSECIKQMNALMTYLLKEFASNSHEIIGETNEDTGVVLIAVLNYLNDLYKTFGFSDLKELKVAADENNDLDCVMDVLVDFRKNVRTIALADRNKRLLEYCDGVREEVNRIGVKITDRSNNVSVWSR